MFFEENFPIHLQGNQKLRTTTALLPFSSLIKKTNGTKQNRHVHRFYGTKISKR